MAGDIPLRKLRIAITGGGLAVNAQRALAEIIPSANELLHKAGAVPMNSIRLVIVSESYAFIPPILSLLQLKRTSATEISSVSGKGAYRIGAEIPPIRWITMKLEMKPRELARYAATHSICTGYLAAGFDSVNNTGIRNMAYHRRLCLAVLSPDLDRVSTLNEKAVTIGRLYHKHQDHGATYLFHRTKPEPDMPIYRDRPSLAYYLCRLSVKLSYLAGLVLELLMLLLNFNVLSIRAKHLLAEREAAVAAFNDFGNHVQVLVTSVKVSATSLNLQKDCADVIFVDVSFNAQSTQQAAGRVIRIGQQRACTIYILTTDYTYDQVLQATAARKMIAVIAAYTNRKVTEADLAQYRQQNPET